MMAEPFAVIMCARVLVTALDFFLKLMSVQLDDGAVFQTVNRIEPVAGALMVVSYHQNGELTFLPDVVQERKQLVRRRRVDAACRLVQK